MEKFRNILKRNFTSFSTDFFAVKFRFFSFRTVFHGVKFRFAQVIIVPNTSSIDPAPLSHQLQSFHYKLYCVEPQYAALNAAKTVNSFSCCAGCSVTSYNSS